MKENSKKWLREDGKKFLREIGIKERQSVLDFGCGNGTYTIPAARVTGKEGKVYAADRDRNSINELLKTAESKGLENIVSLEISEDLKINLENKSIDAVLLYDILHYMDRKQRKELYKEICRILKIGGILSVYPKHNRSDQPLWNLSDMGVEDIVEEIKNSNFHFERKYLKRLMHDGNYEDGVVLNFRKDKTLIIAFGTDNGNDLKDDHFGSAKFFHIYRFHNGKAEMIEERENVKIEENESIKGGDPKKARATANSLYEVDVLAGRRFGPNITRMLNKFALSEQIQ